TVKATGTVQVPLEAASIVWTGAVNDKWETGGAGNFSVSSVSTPFLAGDHVTFNNSGSLKTVALTGVLAPASVTFDHSSGNNYTVAGSGRITGSTGLVKK